MLYRGFMGFVLSLLVVASASSATLYPFLVPVRAELSQQILLANENGNVSEVRLLTQARNAIDRRGRATLTGDLQSLATAATLIGRTRLTDVFDPLLDQAVLDYLAVLEDTVSTLQANIDSLPSGTAVQSARIALEDVSEILEDVPQAATPQAASRLLSRAALRLVAVQSLVSRLGDDLNRPQEMAAFVGSESFSTRNVSALFSAGTGALTVTGTENVRGQSRAITISLAGVRAGTTVHNLGASGSGSRATYSASGTNSNRYSSSTSGYVTVTVDPSAQTATGTFSFVAAPARGFGASVQVTGGTFFARLR